MVTSDLLEAQAGDPREALLIAYDWTPASEEAVRRGARPSVLVSFEPPIIAWSLYYHLPRLSAQFRHVFLFEGARSRVAPQTKFHRLYFPQVRQPGRESFVPWEQRGFLVMVSSNKGLIRNPLRIFDRPREFSLKRELATAIYPPLGDEYYGRRLQAIRHFASAPDFDLFGAGWQRRHPSVKEADFQVALRAYRGTAPSKLDTFARYRFAFALENSRFPGYVSEKLFDCFFSGCVPLYLGAPDVERYVPASTFVNVQDFASDVDLEKFLRAMSPAEARVYLDAAADFLASDSYRKFTHEAFAESIVEALASSS